MSKKNVSSHALFRYWMFQLPALAAFILALIIIDRWVAALPAWLMLLLVVIWIAKDAVLYPFVRRAYESDREKQSPMTGRQAVVKQRLDPSGYVQLDGELWRARVSENDTAVEEGETVKINEIRGLTLYVKRVRSQ